MGEGKWSGGAANRTWGRFNGARVVAWPGDVERAARLAAQLAGELFWCDACGARHALIEHRQCRAAAAAPRQ
jgi:hypothetical protein